MSTLSTDVHVCTETTTGVTHVIVGRITRQDDERYTLADVTAYDPERKVAVFGRGRYQVYRNLPVPDDAATYALDWAREKAAEALREKVALQRSVVDIQRRLTFFRAAVDALTDKAEG